MISLFEYTLIGSDGESSIKYRVGDMNPEVCEWICWNSSHYIAVYNGDDFVLEYGTFRIGTQFESGQYEVMEAIDDELRKYERGIDHKQRMGRTMMDFHLEQQKCKNVRKKPVSSKVETVGITDGLFEEV